MSQLKKINKLKICYIISDIDKAVYFEETALGLRRAGIECAFILIACMDKTLHRFLIANQFQVEALEAGSLLKSRKVIRACKRILIDWNITQVHCHLAQANWIGLWAARFAGIPTRIFTRHSGAPLKIHWKERVIDWTQNRLATKIVAISKNIDELLEKQEVSASKRIIIHHGFQLDRFTQPNEQEVVRIKQTYNPEEQAPVIGVIARWMEWKGIQYIIDAFERLIETYPNARLCLFGGSESGDYYREIEEKLSRLPKRNVCVVSFEQNVYDLYQLFDVYVHVPVNPHCEAFGQTYVEALAAGVPSIFTLSGVAREFIVNHENALVVPFQDSDAIYEALLVACRDKNFTNKLIKQGKEDVVELFAFNAYLQKLVTLYSEN